MEKPYALALIPCSKRKNAVGITPLTLYTSTSFVTALRHAQQRCDQVLVVSAKYGFLQLQERIAHYEAYLPDLDLSQRAALAVEMRARMIELQVLQTPPQQVISYLPAAYFDFLASIDIARDWALQINRPYKRLGFLKVMKVLTDEIRNYPTSNTTSCGPELSGVPRKRIAPDAHQP